MGHGVQQELTVLLSQAQTPFRIAGVLDVLESLVAVAQVMRHNLANVPRTYSFSVLFHYDPANVCRPLDSRLHLASGRVTDKLPLSGALFLPTARLVKEVRVFL